MYLATLPKAVRFDHIKIDDSRKEQRYESQAMGQQQNNR
jgi:hypothetical protein